MTLIKKIHLLVTGAALIGCTGAFLASKFKSVELKMPITKEEKGFNSPFMDWPGCCSKTDCSNKCCESCGNDDPMSIF